MIRVIVLMMGFILISSLSFAAFSTDERFSVSGDTVSLVNYDFVYNKIYLWDGTQWQTKTCSGESLGSGWLDSCTYSLVDDRLSLNPGTYSLAAYACEIQGSSFNCNNDKWLLTTFTVDSPQTVASRFAQEPATYTVGSGVNLDFNLGPQDADVDQIIFQVWHNDLGIVTGGHSDVSIPFSYPSAVLDSIAPGNVQVQALVRSGGSEKFRKTFDMEILPPVSGGFCGDGIVNNGEACDGDVSCTTTNGYTGVRTCSDTCQILEDCVSSAFCGDGQINGEEICDDGNQVSGDGCSSTCQEEVVDPICGNGQIESGETCDDGNQINGDGCSATCEAEVTSEGWLSRAPKSDAIRLGADATKDQLDDALATGKDVIISGDAHIQITEWDPVQMWTNGQLLVSEGGRAVIELNTQNNDWPAVLVRANDVQIVGLEVRAVDYSGKGIMLRDGYRNALLEDVYVHSLRRGINNVGMDNLQIHRSILYHFRRNGGGQNDMQAIYSEFSTDTFITQSILGDAWTDRVSQSRPIYTQGSKETNRGDPVARNFQVIDSVLYTGPADGFQIRGGGSVKNSIIGPFPIRSFIDGQGGEVSNNAWVGGFAFYFFSSVEPGSPKITEGNIDVPESAIDFERDIQPMIDRPRGVWNNHMQDLHQRLMN